MLSASIDCNERITLECTQEMCIRDDWVGSRLLLIANVLGAISRLEQRAWFCSQIGVRLVSVQ